MSAPFVTTPVAGDIYILLKTDRIVAKISGALSVSAEDIDFYDAQTHSLIVDAAMLGNAHNTLAVQANSKAAQTAVDPKGVILDVPDPIDDHSSVIIANQQVAGGLKTEAGVTSGSTFVQANDHTQPPSVLPVLEGAETSYAPALLEDTAFAVATADLTPAPTKKTDTFFRFWSGAAASGNLVAGVWKSQIRFMGPNLPTLLT